MKKIIFVFVGLLFGIVMYKSEAASWFRIYEMFRFESIHMYGMIATALFFGILFIFIIKRLKIKSFDGQTIQIMPKNKSIARYLIGGILFGLGWGLVGVCPGPIFVMIGAGFLPMLIVLISAIFGTFLYGVLQKKLPH